MRALFPYDAPVTLKGALAAMYVIAGLLVIDAVTTAVFDPSGGVILVSVVLAAAMVGLGHELGRARNWARWVTALVCVVLLLSTFSLFARGVPGVVKVVGVIELVLFVAVIALLLVRPTSEWFAPR